MSISSLGLLAAAPAAVPARMLYGTKETEALLSVSHAQLYRLIGAGRLDARKIGARTFITAESIIEFLASLPKLARGE
jgi:hypothetical protein